MRNQLMYRHIERKPTKDAKAWKGGSRGYESYTLIEPIPAVRVSKEQYAQSPPRFLQASGQPDAVQQSGEGIWFAIDAYEVPLPEYLKIYSVPKNPQTQNEWLLQPHTVLNIGVASDLFKGRGGAIQAEFVFGSPLPLLLAHRKVQKNVHM